MAKSAGSKNLAISLSIIALLFTILSISVRDAHYSSSFGFFSRTVSFYYWGTIVNFGNSASTSYWWSSNSNFSSDTVNYMVAAFSTSLLTLFATAASALLIIFGYRSGGRTSLFIGGLGAIGTLVLFYEGLVSFFSNASNASYSMGLGYFLTFGALICCFAGFATFK